MECGSFRSIWGIRDVHWFVARSAGCSIQNSKYTDTVSRGLPFSPLFPVGSRSFSRFKVLDSIGSSH